MDDNCYRQHNERKTTVKKEADKLKQIIKKFQQDNSGVILIALLLFIPFIWLMLGLTLDSTNARYSAIYTKTALNRAVKAAVLALDEEQLALGKTMLDTIRARNSFNEMMRINLKLNPDFTPTVQSPILESPEILDFYICQGPGFPQTYNSVLGIVCTFQDPGVIAVVKIKHKYTFTGNEQEIYVYSSAEVDRKSVV